MFGLGKRPGKAKEVPVYLRTIFRMLGPDRGRATIVGNKKPREARLGGVLR